MLYLFSLKPEYNTDDANWAEPDEPVVPCYPHLNKDVWLSVQSGKLAPYAVVKECDIDPDTLVQDLVKEYPGLPAELHETYVQRTCALAEAAGVDSKFHVRIQQDNATAINATTEDNYILWTKQPLPKLL